MTEENEANNEAADTPLEGDLIPNNPISKKTMTGLSRAFRGLNDINMVKTEVEIKVGEFLTKAKEELRVKRLKKRTDMSWSDWCSQDFVSSFSSTHMAARYMKLHSLAPKVMMIRNDQPTLSIEATIKEAQQIPDEAVVEVVPDTKGKSKKAHVGHATGNNHWYTPEKYLESARRVMGGIDLDPASSAQANELVKAATFYTEEVNGLSKTWTGRVWMNPPYSQPEIGEFTDALAYYIDTLDVTEAISLVNNATETEWFRVLASRCAAVCFPNHRIKFLDLDGNASGSPLQAQAFLYFGDNVTAFKKEFAQYGLVFNHRVLKARGNA